MTDKQIIEYKHTKCTKEDCCLYCGSIYCGYVDDIENLEKAYKAKEQECERWKSNFNGKVSAIEELLKQLDQLKADREEALKQLEFVRTLNTVKEAEIRKLSKTLTEIKEIAEICKCHNADGCYECKYFDDCKVEDEEIPTRDVCKLILQKISECEVEL